MKEIILMLHPTFGMLAVLAALWLFVDALNAATVPPVRLHTAAGAVAVFIWLAFLFGGYWYVQYYAVDKAVIQAGPWSFAHGLIMETKEHVFFTLLLLGSYLPVAVRNDLAADRNARLLVLSSAALVVLLGLAMEGAGAVVALAVKMGLLGS